MILTSLSAEEIECLRELLAIADDMVLTLKEEEFVAGMAERFEVYGANTYVSDAQWKWLQGIADRA